MTTTTVTGAAYVRAVTPTAERAQADFRVLLHVLSRPGLLDAVHPGNGPAALTVAAGLADVEVPTAVLTGPGEEHWARALHLATSAPAAPPETARMVVALRPPAAAEITALTRGDALHPEFGTRLIAAVSALSQENEAEPRDEHMEGPEVVLALSGPGVPGTRRIRVSGLDRAVFNALAAANADFPAGIDTFLVAADGTVAGLPRSTRIEIENGDD
ncbi:phosphonate C-P lyase system protein PhnH [Nonomuraea jiangxiensis]|uniref:Alpha-D-ribose 1-methylphosphonate 5-triphosphate synthase subunit PhnH n=1 Tax=Nonomuraea jiangxiensis TaxID=633440 RepID=A0A1G8D2S9_9ACTN|nr:phosphonate C-P lyase system protein PhnH [Nonomuraea jiangxiensis]SDH52036.1 alpha-D-ribose 1-methylphosphonate 5-triphosphate synthase subunit PhnH [Nonomuraea jiangxiensis]